VIQRIERATPSGLRPNASGLGYIIAGLSECGERSDFTEKASSGLASAIDLAHACGAIAIATPSGASLPTIRRLAMACL
jgi:hypothetical protein